MTMLRTAALAALAALSLGAGAPGTPDRPETGKQGETLPGEEHMLPVPYSKGVNVIGHSTLDDRGGNLIMAWAGRCAYVADGVGFKASGSLDMASQVGPHSGVAVIDVGDPANPRVVRYLQDKGALFAAETVNASVGHGHAVLLSLIHI